MIRELLLWPFVRIRERDGRLEVHLTRLGERIFRGHMDELARAIREAAA